MPFVSSSSQIKSRYLISGFSNSGKTTSLITFLYGSNDYWSDEEHAAAVEYANGKKMVIISCPGEFGIKSLPSETEHITRYFYEMGEKENISDVKWSINVLDQFDALFNQMMKEQPDILVVDGVHHLWSHGMNKTTGGAYLDGSDLSINPANDSYDPYRPAGFYNKAHTAFGERINKLYVSKIPMIVCTTLEEWEAGSGGDPSKKPPGMNAQKFLWPAIAGQMAKQIVSKFDARLSARLEYGCYYGEKCTQGGAEKELHHVWQFYPRGDVAGVGIKGLKVTERMKKAPYIHQSYQELQWLIGR